MTTLNISTNLLEPQRDCPRCKGKGQTDNEWIYNHSLGEGHYGTGPCKACKATGKFVKPDFDAILNAITKTVKGSDRRAFRASQPKAANKFANLEEGRAYYVWRMVRFHSGRDVTMPVVAMMVNDKDPYTKELDAMADAVAKQCFGTNMAAAYRWGNALGYNVSPPDTEPASAFSGGPVVMDNNKPPEEHPELF